MTELDDFRVRKDHFFAHDARSPLTPDQHADFQGLAYFPENPALRIEADLDTNVEPGEVRLQTSTGDEQAHRRAGTIRFEVDGEPAVLTLFASEETDELFLPFRDSTTGKETYPAGRYLDVEPAADGKVVVDLNFAYNPYCAYNPHWSCPLPPVENWLKVPIRAGEKDFGTARLGP